MAEQVTLNPTEDFPFIKEVVSGHVRATTPATGLGLFIADAPCMLQGFSLRPEVAAGTACRAVLLRVPSGTAITAGTGMIGVGDGAGATGLGQYLDMNTAATVNRVVGVNGTYRLDRSNVVLAKGDMIALLFLDGDNVAMALPSASLTPAWTLTLSRVE